MHTRSVDYRDDFFDASGKSPPELEDELTLLVAVKLFELGRLSLGNAADPVRRNKTALLFNLRRLGTPAIDLDEDQIADGQRNS